MAAMDVEVLVFDLFGVVLAFDDDIVCGRIAPYCRDPRTSFDGIRALMSSYEVVTGRLGLRQIYDRLVECHGLSLDRAAFEAAWLAPYTWPMPGMSELLRALCRRYELVLLSNVDRHYWDVVRAGHPELGCFDSLLLSWELGLAKPEQEIFLRAIEAAGVDAFRCLFIDDSRANVETAQAMGFQTHWFRSMSGLLKRIGPLLEGNAGRPSRSRSV